LGNDIKILTNKLQDLQSEEGIDLVKFFSFKKVLNMIKKQELTHAQSITGLMLYMLIKNKAGDY